jgi:hypothetical protein
MKYYDGDQVEEDEIGGACSTHGKDENCIHSEDAGVDGKIILEWILGK